MTTPLLNPETMQASERIDAHHHLWRYDPAEFGWLNDEMAALRRDFTVQDLEAEMQAAGVGHAVAVQARCSLEETEFLLECARSSNRIAGVVGWVPLAESSVDEVLQRFAEHIMFCGVREVAQGQAPGFLDRPAFNNGLRQVTQSGLTYDLLIYADQLPEATRLVDRHPSQRFVLDHAAKPRIAANLTQPWRKDLQALARRPNVTCKLSGLVTEADWGTWTLGALTPYLDACVEAFGPERLLAGSDWPVCLVATGYTAWWETLKRYFAGFSRHERAAIFGGNAVREYKLSSLDPAS